MKRKNKIKKENCGIFGIFGIFNNNNTHFFQSWTFSVGLRVDVKKIAKAIMANHF